MVDLRIPERDIHDRAVVRLSQTARHDYWSLMLLATSMRSDGVIEVEDLPMVPWGIDRASLAELVQSGLLEKSGAKAWTLTRFASTQTRAIELDSMAAVRDYERIKKQRSRARNAGMDDAEVDRRFPLIPSSESPGIVRGHAKDRPEPEPETEPGQASDYGEAEQERLGMQTGEVGGEQAVPRFELVDGRKKRVSA